MLGLTPDVVIMLTIVAAFTQSVVLLFTLIIFYKNLLVLKRHNELTLDRFDYQSKVEKYDLSLKFADWVKSELNEYIPHIKGDIPHLYLTKNEIQVHFTNIAINMVELINEEIVFKTLMLDEIKKLHITLDSLENDNPMVEELKKLIDIDFQSILKNEN